MMRSMFSGVSGLRTHQIRMDVIGNNIANVNTFGFRASRATFEDVLSQTLKGAFGPTAANGGANPQQIGLGIALGSIDMINTQGSLQLTGRDTDMAVTGSGFFVLREGNSLNYTRAGAFDLDAAGYLVNPGTGQRVQGWVAKPDGTFDVRDLGTLTDLQIPLGQSVLATASSKVAFGQNLDAGAAVGATQTATTVMYDGLGNPISVRFTFTKAANNQWTWSANLPGNATALATGTINYNNDGTYASATVNTGGGPVSPCTVTVPGQNGAASTTLTLDFAGTTQASNAGQGSTLLVQSHDGNTMGSLQSFTIDQSGVISGVYSNGTRRPIAQVAVGVFPNPDGLQKIGHNAYQSSTNSGLAQIGPPGSGGRGSIAPSNLEMSNVDIAQEFTNMIITQRGFQANSRIITASDEMLQDLVNLKR